MGTDIHAVVERRINGVWEPVEVPEKLRVTYYEPETTTARYRAIDDCHYDLFAVLADVRNGYGFAGVATGQAVTPIAAPRGLPDDLSVLAQGWVDNDDEDGMDFGDHSFSWVSLAELLVYPWHEGRKKTGVIPLEEFARRERDGVTERPEGYSGSIFGPDIHTLSTEDARAFIASNASKPGRFYVQIEWGQPILAADDVLLTEWIPWMQTLGAPDDVRLVFGFDS